MQIESLGMREAMERDGIHQAFWLQQRNAAPPDSEDP